MKTLVIGFEGINRVGKGTQIEQLRINLDKLGIENLVVRGEGSRSGLGLEEGDPYSPWWQEFNRLVRASDDHLAPYELWEQGAHMIANELVYWKNFVLPRLAMRSCNETGVLLVDRTFLSRISPVMYEGRYNGIDSLYAESNIFWQELLPDLVFLLQAPKEILLSRLDIRDPKYNFRKHIIEEKYDLFYEVCNDLPKIVESRLIHIDSNASINHLSEIIISTVANFTPT